MGFGRLAPSATFASATTELAGLAPRMRAAFNYTEEYGRGNTVTALRDSLLQREMRYLLAHTDDPAGAKATLPAMAQASALWLPGVAFMVAFFLVPVGWIVAQSVLDPGFTLQFYERLAGTPEYALVLWISVKIGLVSFALLLSVNRLAARRTGTSGAVAPGPAVGAEDGPANLGPPFRFV